MSAITTPKTITVFGGNLVAIAAKELGDASQFIRLMRINNLSDPILSGQVTLIIPAIDKNQTGGLPWAQ